MQLTTNRHQRSGFLTFKEQQRTTGYATHGLFPYKGKFHPQLIRSFINILQIPNDGLILDPMAGSGTANIDANLMGIDSVAIDISPISEKIIQGKLAALEHASRFLAQSTRNLLELMKIHSIAQFRMKTRINIFQIQISFLYCN